MTGALVGLGVAVYLFAGALLMGVLWGVASKARETEIAKLDASDVVKTKVAADMYLEALRFAALLAPVVIAVWPLVFAMTVGAGWAVTKKGG